MPELVLFILFILGLLAIELWYVFHGQKTISEHVQDFFRRWPAIGFIAGVVVGWFGAHFFGG